MAKLKVYRTAIGFHDAYVAAPSQKAALAAWGTNKPLFARGAAEVVTDPALIAAPLARPGEVVKRLRGSAEEQLAALPMDRPKRSGPVRDGKTPKPVHRARPAPSRAQLDKGEQAVRAAEQRHHAAMTEFEEREQAMRDERRALEQTQSREMDALVARRDKAKNAYRAALDR